MSLKKQNHTVKLQNKVNIQVPIPVIPVDTSIHNLSQERRSPMEAMYSGDNPDFAYKSATEQRHLLEEIKTTNQQNQNSVDKYQRDIDNYNNFKKSLEPQKTQNDGGE